MGVSDTTQLYMLMDKVDDLVRQFPDFATKDDVAELGKEIVEVKLHLVQINGQVGYNTETNERQDERLDTVEDRVGDTRRMKLERNQIRLSAGMIALGVSGVVSLIIAIIM